MAVLRLPSVFTVLKAGVGPSSSHTLGPIMAARDFRQVIEEGGVPAGQLEVALLGSLALTGKGHLSDLAVTAGLGGFDPEGDPRDTVLARYRAVREAGSVRIAGRDFEFQPDRDISFDASKANLPHPNTLRFKVKGKRGKILAEATYLSVGGGRVLGGTAPEAAEGEGPRISMTGAVEACLTESKDLAQLCLESEVVHHGRTREEVYARLESLWSAMSASIDRGLEAEGLLPGKLQLERRAKEMFENYQEGIRQWRVLSREITLASIYAISVAEENASGGRVVTAPTCGSSGIVPALLQMLRDRFRLPDRRVCESLMVAGLVGAIAAKNASVSGAEVGCQGEVGVASAMAAAAACHLLEGNVPQVEFAAETALEHHLGLTCDPVYGLVQIPCIERNAVGAVTALNAANLALLGSGNHFISFDAALATLQQVGNDMPRKYKETALGGLATARIRRGSLDSA